MVGPRSWGRSVGNGFGGNLRSWSRSLGNIANVVDFEDFVDFAGAGTWGIPAASPPRRGGWAPWFGNGVEPKVGRAAFQPRYHRRNARRRKKRFFGQILAGSLLEANFWHSRAFGLAIKIPFWNNWETTVLGQLLVESPLKANFGNFRALGPATKIPFWDNWETAVLGQILAGSPLEARFGNLRAFGLTIKIPFWDNWETTVGPNPGRERFESKFRPLEGLWAGNQNPVLRQLGNGRFGPNPGREPFGSKFRQFEGPWAGN